MKIVTWNINSLRLRMNLVKALIEEQKPDVICFQEIKVEDNLFPLDALKDLGYQYIVYCGQKSYHGVAIISKIHIDDSFCLEFYNKDKRHISARIKGFEIHNFYIPAGGDEPDININPKFKHKLEYISLIQNWFTENRNFDDRVIVLGDLNIAPHEHDVWSSKQLKKVVSHTDIERKMLLDLQASLNFVDSARHFVPYGEKIYTWWSYRNKEWNKSNRGRRLDHIWVSKNLQNYMKQIIVLRDFRNSARPSDHIPYILELIQ